MKITENDFDVLERQLKELKAVEIRTEELSLPTLKELERIKEEDRDRFAAYLLWLQMHAPLPETEEERLVMKRISKLVNTSFELID